MATNCRWIYVITEHAMCGNATCADCGLRGERGLQVVIYRDAEKASPAVMLCEDCALVRESEGADLWRLSDQSGQAA